MNISFEQAFNSFLEKEKPDYLDLIKRVKLDEPFLSGLILKNKSSLVLVTPSRLISMSNGELTIFYLEQISNLNFKKIMEAESNGIQFKINFVQGNVKLTFSKLSFWAEHFMSTLQSFSLGLKLKVPMPEPEEISAKLGFDTSGTIISTSSSE